MPGQAGTSLLHLTGLTFIIALYFAVEMGLAHSAIPLPKQVMIAFRIVQDHFGRTSGLHF